MGVAAGISKKAIRFTNYIVDTAVLIVVILLIAMGCYAIWDSKQVYQAADAARYEIYKPTTEDNGLSFSELQAINPDVFAWLTVYGTHIDYPVVQGPDNMTYVNTNTQGGYSLSGAIFLDCYSSKDFSDFSSILYGHHMEKQVMFGEIGLFSDKSYFDAREYGMLYFEGQEHGLEFFAFVHADAYDGEVFRAKIEGEEARQAYLDLLLSMASHTRDIRVTTDDNIVLLSTCSASSTNGRDILVGRITHEIYDDPFKLDETDNIKIALKVDTLSGLWVKMPVCGRVIILVPPLLLMLLCMTIKNKKLRKENAILKQMVRKMDEYEDHQKFQ